MWPRDDRLSLQQMLETGTRAVEVAGARGREAVETDWVLRLGLTKAVEIVGEAAGRVSIHVRERWPEVPWREAIATRNRLTHGYDTVDSDQLWETIVEDFPPLLDALRRVLAELDADPQG